MAQAQVWPNGDNSFLFEDLSFVETPPPMGGCVGGWVVGWVNEWGQVKSQLFSYTPL